MDFIPIFLKIPTEEIVILQLLLESYEGIGILRTLNRQRGEVVIITLFETFSTMRELLTSIQESLKFQEIPAPDDIKNDWLLAACYG